VGKLTILAWCVLLLRSLPALFLCGLYGATGAYAGNTLTIKTVVNGGTATSSTFLVHVTDKNGAEVAGAPSPGNSAGVTYQNLAVGSYTVSAGGPAVYLTTFSGDCLTPSSGAVITMATRSTVVMATSNANVCTITESMQSSLRIVTLTDGTASPSNFFVDVMMRTGTVMSTKSLPNSPQRGSAGGVVYDMLLPGTYSLASSPASYQASYSADCDATGSVAIPAGSSKTCIITNSRRPPDSSSLTIARDREFSGNSFIYTPLADNAPIDPLSASWVASLQRQIQQYWGVASVNTNAYTPPLYIVGPAQPTVPVVPDRPDDPTFPTWGYPLQEQLAAVPLPDNFQPSAGTDAEAIIYQPSTKQYWELWAAHKMGTKTVDSAGRAVDQWGAGWGGRIDDISVNPGYFVPGPPSYVNFGASASGIAFLGTIMSVDEQRTGVVNHPVQLNIVETRSNFWNAPPAQRTDGWVDDPYAIPEGTIFRLPANLDLDAMDMDPYARMIAKAAQKYGMVIADTSGSTVFRAENPGNRYAVDPYYGPGGIMRCPAGTDPNNPPEVCLPSGNTDTHSVLWGGNGRLRGFPWNLLRALQTNLITWQ
jgi:hypothetical protein